MTILAKQQPHQNKSSLIIQRLRFDERHFI